MPRHSLTITLAALGLGSWLITSGHGLWLILGWALMGRVAWMLLVLYGTVTVLTKAVADAKIERLSHKQEVSDEGR